MRKSDSRAIANLIFALVNLVFVIVFAVIKAFSHLIYALFKQHQYKSLDSSQIDVMDGIEFEHYVGFLLKERGYSTKVTSASSDYGVDVIASIGNDRYAVQVKRYSSNVSRKAVSDAVGGKDYYNCNKSMVVTNSYFTKGAIELARGTGCTLIDRDVLATWIKEREDKKLREETKLKKETKPKKEKKPEQGKKNTISRGAAIWFILMAGLVLSYLVKDYMNSPKPIKDAKPVSPIGQIISSKKGISYSDSSKFEVKREIVPEVNNTIESNAIHASNSADETLNKAIAFCQGKVRQFVSSKEGVKWVSFPNEFHLKETQSEYFIAYQGDLKAAAFLKSNKYEAFKAQCKILKNGLTVSRFWINDKQIETSADAAARAKR